MLHYSTVLRIVKVFLSQIKKKIVTIIRLQNTKPIKKAFDCVRHEKLTKILKKSVNPIKKEESSHIYTGIKKL